MENKISTEDYLKLLKNRVTQLLLVNNMSETKLSLLLGHHPGYINQITSGKINPSMESFLEICECLDVEPSYFFDPNIDEPLYFYEAIEKLKKLESKDFDFIMMCMNHCLDK